MTATYPIVERIAQALVTILAAIKPSTYQMTVVRVDRPGLLESYSPVAGGVALTQEDPDEDGDTESASGLKQWIQQFHIHCFLPAPSAGDTTPLDQTANIFRADVEKAVVVAARGDATLSALITDLHIRPPDSGIFIPNRAFQAVSVNVDIHYRTRENDPYSL